MPTITGRVHAIVGQLPETIGRVPATVVRMSEEIVAEYHTCLTDGSNIFDSLRLDNLS
jgi:hypothetical protein